MYRSEPHIMLLPLRPHIEADVVMTARENTIRIPAMDLTVDGALLRFPVPLVFVEQILKLVLHVKSENDNQIIMCDGFVQEQSQGRRLVFSEMPSKARKELKGALAH